MTALSGNNAELCDRRRALVVGGRFDADVILIVGILMLIGMVMVYSASVTVRGARLDWRVWWESPLRQCVFAVVAFVVLVLVSRIDYRILGWVRAGTGWRSGALLLVATGLLLAMLVPGVGQRALGAQRAIVLLRSPLTLSFQPAEVAKLVLVVWVAAFATRVGGDIRDFRRGFGLAMLSAGILIALTGLEDFGTAALMGVVTLIMLFVSGARWLHLIGTGLCGLAAGSALIWMRPYRWERIVTFFSEQPDPSGEGYQVTQSLIALGSGGWLGRGLGAGVQKYGYLPQDNNDFILAIICEELGIVGGLFVAALFVVLLYRGWQIARSADSPFGRLLAAGLTLMICLQAAFNIGVVTNSIPTKGISLPFVSAGGSGVLFLGIGAGLLAAVGRGCGERGVLESRVGGVGESA